MSGQGLPPRFAGKSVIVTGAAQGIGKEVAVSVAREGGRVLLVDRSPLVEEVARAIVEEGGVALPMTADLETWSGNVQVMEKAQRSHGAIDVLVNNVGGAIWMRPFQHFDERQIEAEISRSLFPALWGCRAVLPIMLEQGRGTIVNVSSIATKGINRVPYSAAKGAVNALTASLAFEVGTRNIRINAVAPGGTTAPPRKVPRGTDQRPSRTSAGCRRSSTRPSPPATCTATACFARWPPQSSPRLRRRLLHHRHRVAGGWR